MIEIKGESGGFQKVRAIDSWGLNLYLLLLDLKPLAELT